MKKVKLDTSKLRIRKETITNLSADAQAGVLGGGITDTVQNTINDLYCNPANTYQAGCVMSWDNTCGGGGGGTGTNPPTGACGGTPPKTSPPCYPSLKECLPMDTTRCYVTGACSPG